MAEQAKLFRKRGGNWSRRFIELAGSAKEFPYAAHPPIVSNKLREFRRVRGLKVENWRS